MQADELAFTPITRQAGLPLGVQLVGRANDEATLLIEAERPWAHRRPAIA